MRTLRDFVREILVETVGDVYYHGGRAGATFGDDKPAYFALEREGAEWYALSRGGNTPTIYTARLSCSNPANGDDLREAVKRSGATGQDVSTHSTNGPDDFFNDYLYVPKVRRELENMGFDSFKGWDTLTNEEIEIVVVWHASQIQIVSSETVQRR